MIKARLGAGENAGDVDVRLRPIDIGFDLRVHDMPVVLPDAFESVSLTDKDGEDYMITGARSELVAEIRRAGYKIFETGGGGDGYRENGSEKSAHD